MNFLTIVHNVITYVVILQFTAYYYNNIRGRSIVRTYIGTDVFNSCGHSNISNHRRNRLVRVLLSWKKNQSAVSKAIQQQCISILLLCTRRIYETVNVIVILIFNIQRYYYSCLDPVWMTAIKTTVGSIMSDGV